MESFQDAPEALDLAPTIVRWFDASARSLPWRTDPTPWGVLVSEVMLQQTPVARVEPVWTDWLRRWPTPSALAGDSPAAAIRAWGRLGYPRRALRLHAAASAITAEHDGLVPTRYRELIALPGIGDYTASAVVSFAFAGRATVLDVNVRRLFARLLEGQPSTTPHVTAAERRLADALVPEHEPARWAAATMELGQVVCTARNPDCDRCPVADRCAWLAAGKPGADQRTTKPQSFIGTDRQVRGLIVERLRAGGASRLQLDALWTDVLQLARALDSLVADGLVDPVTSDTFALPGDPPR
ncbi:MAG: A/G-specific adenine glycosylase [Candidatus Nanopelagicales bacterium]